jgi:GTPase involved in cell partitioning and DNA repair
MQDIQIEERQSRHPAQVAQPLKISPKIDGDYLRKLIRVEALARELDLLKEKTNLIQIYETLAKELDTFDDEVNTKRVKEEFEKVYSLIDTEVTNAE